MLAFYHLILCEKERTNETIWLEEKIAHYAHFTGTENNGLFMSLFHEK